ncbi:hypothetical protein P7H70_14320 [Vagococcus carniphilus]|uniref:Uncharacterized protein n=1 Tax=Vagococcus carniphilus TaxID=218144 RepID=A0AAW8UB52_9ENTE|nr:hypothetical protein [Vagococcus carniphilus]MDT2835206.1 hypothetical protein [Vagococcus carniphilus]
MKTDKEMQTDLKNILKRLDESVHEMCSTRRRAMIDAAKRDVDKSLKGMETVTVESEAEEIYSGTLADVKETLTSLSKDNIDLRVDEARTQLNMGFYGIKDL